MWEKVWHNMIYLKRAKGGVLWTSEFKTDETGDAE